jgi:polyphosphate kinase
MRHVLSRFSYADKDAEVVGDVDRRIVGPAAEVYEKGENEDHLLPRL